MSHPDPYTDEPRGWDRSERPVALPWPEQELEAGQWSRRPAAGPELYAEPRTRPYADPYPADPYDERGRTVRPDDRDRFDDRDAPPYFDDRDVPPRFDDDAGFPTAQLAPIGAEILADDDPVTEPEPPRGRRPRGRRRASLDRPATQQVGTGRAGRNLPAAIGVGLGLGALIVVPLAFYPLAFLPVIAAAIAVGIWEMARAVRRSGAHPPLVPLLAGGVLTIGLAWFAGPDALSLGLLVTVLGTMVWRLGDGPAGFQRDLTAATLIAVYVPFLGGFAALLAAAPTTAGCASWPR